MAVNFVDDTRGYARVRDWLWNRCGMSFPDGKRELLSHRLSRVTHRFGMGNLSDLAEALESDVSHALTLAVIHAASTNHTFFFREQRTLDFFQDHILPTLSENGPIRIWSAATSGGDEAYTLAIIVAEKLGRTRMRQQLSILGTDISEPMIQQAEAGMYGITRLEQTDPVLLAHYFAPAGLGQYQVAHDLRSVCTFRRMNLKAAPYPFQKKFHAVFCRNVLYYFDRPHQIATLEAIYDVVEPGGWLLTSVTETVRNLDTRWQPVIAGVYRKDAH